VFGLCAGIYLSFLSGSRGGWVAIPVFILIWGIFITRQYVFRNLAIISIVLLLSLLLTYFFIDVVHVRIDETYQNIRDFSFNPDTSVGIRLQQWHVAWLLFIENPMFGIGYSAFPDVMESMISRGLITEVAAGHARSEVHNELLAKAVGMGIFGLLSIISIYLVPLIIFLRSSDSENRVAPFMGICFVICFFIFGLTVEIFNLKMTASFYSLTVTLLLAASMNNKPRKCQYV